MNFVRFSADNNSELKGILEDGQIRQIYGSYLQTFSVTEHMFDADSVAYLPPVLPMTILCVSGPHSYMKSPSSLTGSGAYVDYINLPDGTNTIFYTPRVCWVVKNRNHDKQSGATLFGFTFMLDFSLEGPLPKPNSKWSAHSALDSSDGFTVLGKTVSTDLSSAPMALPAAEIKAFAERISFRPGDIIAFGHEQIACHRGEHITFGDLEAFIR